MSKIKTVDAFIRCKKAREEQRGLQWLDAGRRQ